jgi:uncharacterized membrane protein YtjA (UPF0391 family)
VSYTAKGAAPIDATTATAQTATHRTHAQRHPPARRLACAQPPGGPTLLYYAVVFFVIALVAAVFGFGGIAAGAVGIGKLLFVVFLVMAVVSMLLGVFRRG